MSFALKWKYYFGDDYHKPVKILISYNLYVKGDMETAALEIDKEPFEFDFTKETQEIQDLIIYKTSDWGWGSNVSLAVIRGLYSEEIQKLCEEKLMAQRAEGITELTSGVLLKGEHFIKCVAELWMDEHQKLTYPEFEAYILRKKK